MKTLTQSLILAAAILFNTTAFAQSSTKEATTINTVARTLPLELLSFTAAANKKLVDLKWQTSQEINSSYFEVQRSTDGSKFESIATNTAKGNTSLNVYQATDDLFFYTFQTAYYRLRMVNINGTYRYSPIVTVQLNGAVKSGIKTWPAPFVNEINFNYTSEVSGEIRINVTSMSGSTYLMTNSPVIKGQNTITINQAQSIPSGTYLLVISNGEKTDTVKVIKH